MKNFKFIIAIGVFITGWTTFGVVMAVKTKPLPADVPTCEVTNTCETDNENPEEENQNPGEENSGGNQTPDEEVNNPGEDSQTPSDPTVPQKPTFTTVDKWIEDIVAQSKLHGAKYYGWTFAEVKFTFEAGKGHRMHGAPELGGIFNPIAGPLTFGHWDLNDESHRDQIWEGIGKK